ncbi:MAG: RNA polymerase sigma factor, partial [Bacteroidota bacterium]
MIRQEKAKNNSQELIEDPSKNKEKVLLEKFRNSHNTEYLGELYSSYIHLVYGVCLKYLKERERSRDAVMEIFEKLIEEIPRHDIRNFKSWLYVLTKNFCLMELRSSKIRIEKEKIYIEEEKIFMESGVKMHPVDEEGSELNKALQECIEALKNEQKECIRMFYYKDKCYEEISQIMNLELKKVKSYLQN